MSEAEGLLSATHGAQNTLSARKSAFIVRVIGQVCILVGLVSGNHDFSWVGLIWLAGLWGDQ